MQREVINLIYRWVKHLRGGTNHFSLGVQGKFLREDVPLEHLREGDICIEY